MEDHSVVGEGEPTGAAEGGDVACWAHLVCQECGAVVSEGHRQGCALQGIDLDDLASQ